MLTTKRRTLGWFAATSALGTFALGCGGSGGSGTLPDSGADGPSAHDSGKQDAGSHDGGKDSGSKDTGTKDHAAPGDVSVSDAGDARPPGIVAVTPAQLAFGNAGGSAGFVACGTSPDAKTFTVTNNGTASLTWWTAFGLGGASPYSLGSTNCSQAAPCTLAAGASAMVTVTAPPVPANAGITTYDDTVTVFSSAPGDTGHPVALLESSYGAILALSPTDENFGQQPNAGVYTDTVQILNSGNAPVTAGVALTSGSSSQFTVSAATVDVAVAGGSFGAIFTPAGSTAAVTGAVALSVPANSTCAPLPANLTLEGQGTAAVISVTSSLNFNSGTNGNNGIGVSCGTTGPTLNVVVKNSGTQIANITALSLAGGSSSPYTIPAATLSALPIAVAAGASVNVPVVPSAVPASSAPGLALNDTLSLTTDANGDVPHAVALNETTAGAVLTLVPTAIDFNATQSGSRSTYQLALSNAGNVAAPVTLGVSTDATIFTFDTGVVAAPGATVSPNAYFSPTATETYTASGTMVVAAGTPLCSGSAATTNLTASGTGTSGNIYAVAPSRIDFGKSTCGSSGNLGTAPAAQQVTITNNSLNSTTWTAALAGPDAAFFTLSAASGNVAGPVPGPNTTSFSVTPVALGSTSGLTASQVEFGLSATVTVTVGTGTSAETFTVPVSEMPYGAYAVWSTAHVNVRPGSSASFALRNLSSDVLGFSLASGSASYVVSPTSGNASLGSPLTSSVKNNSTSAVTTSITASLTTATDPLCAPLPAPLPVN